MIRVEKYAKHRHFDRILKMQLREADREELWASTGLPQGEGLIRSVNKSDIVCYVYLNGKEIIALSGASYTELSTFAIVWALGTDDVLKYWDEVEPLFTSHVNGVLDTPGIELIGNKIDMRNKAHIRWLQKLDFTFSGQYTELGGHKFEIFYKGK